MTVTDVFTRCVEAIHAGLLIERVSSTDKEFHFQNWLKARLQETGDHFESGGRNSYPDFRMVAATDGYEVKGLAYPLAATRVSTATARRRQANTTGGRSITSSVVIPKSPMETHIRSSTWWFVTAIF